MKNSLNPEERETAAEAVSEMRRTMCRDSILKFARCTFTDTSLIDRHPSTGSSPKSSRESPVIVAAEWPLRRPGAREEHRGDSSLHSLVGLL